MKPQLSLKEVGKQINKYLERFEADPKINKNTKADRSGLSDYYQAGAVASGRFVYVTYIAYQGHSHLTRDEALGYLRWLDRGGVGSHFEVKSS